MTGVAQHAGPLVVAASPASVFAAVGRGLPSTDGRRGDTFRPGHQRARAAARLLVRWCAARVTGRPLDVFEIVQRCVECGSGDHGKPSLAGFPDLHVSFAHRPGAVVAAAGWSPVGVDVEMPPGAAGGVVDVLGPDVLAPAEVAEVRTAADPAAAFLRLWVRKECLAKLGVTTLDTMRDVDLAGAASRPLAGVATWTGYGRLHLVDWADGDTGAVVAAAGHDLPVRGALPSARVAD